MLHHAYALAGLALEVLDPERAAFLQSRYIDMGFLLTEDYVKVAVHDYLHGQGWGSTFGSSGLPGWSWWEGFLS